MIICCMHGVSWTLIFGGLSNIWGAKQRRRQDIGSGLTPFQWSQPKIWGGGAGAPPGLQVGNPMVVCIVSAHIECMVYVQLGSAHIEIGHLLYEYQV